MLLLYRYDAYAGERGTMKRFTGLLAGAMAASFPRLILADETTIVASAGNGGQGSASADGGIGGQSADGGIAALDASGGDLNAILIDETRRHRPRGIDRDADHDRDDDRGGRNHDPDFTS
jgi:hypothetical protein